MQCLVYNFFKKTLDCLCSLLPLPPGYKCGSMLSHPGPSKRRSIMGMEGQKDRSGFVLSGEQT